eukprot:1000627-Pyramimonas_sp.AAC.1
MSMAEYNTIQLADTTRRGSHTQLHVRLCEDRPYYKVGLSQVSRVSGVLLGFQPPPHLAQHA